jgi:hypothetical protein
MPRRFVLIPALELDELAGYHQDVVTSLRFYFNPSAPTFIARFAGQSLHEVDAELALRLHESDVRSTFAVITSLETTFRVDFDLRCRKRLKDNLSVYFRRIEKTYRNRVRLNEHILEGWKRHSSASAALISELRGAFKFRHWVAHGRYWTPKLGRKYDFAYIHLLAEAIVSGFPFEV